MTMLTTGAVTHLWQTLVREAGTRARTALDEALESYLVFALVRHSRDHRLVHRTMALEFLDGLTLDGAAGIDRLRDVGDRCLLVAGLFAGQSRRRRVSEDYYIELGRGAYRQLGERDRSALATLYCGLADGFQALVDVLRMIRGMPPSAWMNTVARLPAMTAIPGSLSRH